MLNRNEAWTNLTHTISKTLEYPLPTTTIPLEKWKEVATIVHQAALPKAGFVCTFAHAVLCGPTKCQGLGGCMCKWHDQELTHLKLLVDQVQKGTTFGLKLQMTIEQLRLETGFLGHGCSMERSAPPGHPNMDNPLVAKLSRVWCEHPG